MSYLTDVVVGELITSQLLDHPVDKAADDVIETVRDECAHIAESIYIDCSAEEQATVQMVQELIAQQIMSRLS